jgi:hypothetical protein
MMKKEAQGQLDRVGAIVQDKTVEVCVEQKVSAWPQDQPGFELKLDL